MPDYWRNRYAQALSSCDEARSASTRLAYLQLADHYRAMIRFTEGRAPAAQERGIRAAGQG